MQASIVPSGLLTDRELVVRDSRQVLAHNGRTFNLAGKLLPRQHRDDASVIYAFCRLADDLADEAPDLKTAERDLQQLADELHGKQPQRPLISTFLDVCERTQIPSAAADFLLKGLRSDLNPVLLQSDTELIQYGYCVAGTVGLMMSGVIGVQAAEATPHAIDLGIGMQITNICRDVLEDAQRGRVYLPADRLEAAGLTQEELLAGTTNRTAVFQVVSDLLELAERYYRSADDGMRYIPWRARTAILCASRMYRAIGRRILRRNLDVLAGRTWVPTYEKVGWCAYGVAKSLSVQIKPHRIELHNALRGYPGAAQ